MSDRREKDDLVAHAYDYVPEFFAASADAAEVEEIAWIMRNVRGSGVDAAIRSMAETDLRDILPLIAVPVLLLYGDADSRSPLSVAKALHASIPGSTLVILPGIGHLANVDAPDLFNLEVRRFLATAPSD